MKGTASAPAAGTVLSICFVLAALTVKPSLSSACTYVDPQVSASGYKQWCACIGGTYSERPYRCDPGAGSGSSQGGVRQVPGYDRQAEQRRQEQELRQQQQRRAEEEARRREQERRRQFEQDKQKALKQLKSGSDKLGLKSASGGSSGLKGSGSTAMKLKEPRFSKGHKGSAPPDLGGLNPKWPIITDPAKVQGGTRSELKAANLRTHMLLDALEAGHGDWQKSIRFLQTRLKENPRDLSVRDALNLLRGYYNGYLGAKEISDDHYKYGVRKWLEEDFDRAARAFARAYRENRGDMLLLGSFAHTLGLRDASGKCKAAGACSHIDIPRWQLVRELGIEAEMQKNLDEARAAVRVDSNNLKLRASLNYLEGLVGYNDYLSITREEKQPPFNKKTMQLTSRGLARVGAGDYDGAFKAFSEAYKDNVGDEGIRFAMNYAGGLSAAQRGDGRGIPDALWDERTRQVYEERAMQIDDLFMMGGASAKELIQQLKNTQAENPFFGLLSDEDVERLRQGDDTLFR